MLTDVDSSPQLGHYDARRYGTHEVTHGENNRQRKHVHFLTNEINLSHQLKNSDFEGDNQDAR
jgi:hypothetical protein